MNTHAVSCQWLQLLTTDCVGIYILFKILLKRYEYTRSQLSMIATDCMCIHISLRIFVKKYEYTRSQLSMVATVDN